MAERNNRDVLEKVRQLDKERRILISEFGLNLLEVVYDIQGALVAIHGLAIAKEASVKIGLSELDNVSDNLAGFLGEQPTFIAASSRTLNEKDKLNLKPGEHPGYYLSYRINSGYVLRINVYGGLRSISSQDFRDTSPLRSNHSQRTDRVISQHTYLNWHMQQPDGKNLSEVWLRYSPNQSFTLDSLSHQDNRVEFTSVISNQNYGPFKQLEQPFNQNVGFLAELIPAVIT